MRDMLTIVWDVDDVLNTLTCAWFEGHWLKCHPDCSVRYDELVRNPPAHLLGISDGEYLASLDEFRLSAAFAQLQPVPEVAAWFRQHGGHYRHIALTAAPLTTAPRSAEWVMRHFGRWIRCFGVVPSKREGEQIPVYDETKKDYLEWLRKGDVFVDDNPVNVAAARTLGMQSVLISRPWNDGTRTVAESLGSLTTLSLEGPT